MDARFRKDWGNQNMSSHSDLWEILLGKTFFCWNVILLNIWKYIFDQEILILSHDFRTGFLRHSWWKKLHMFKLHNSVSFIICGFPGGSVVKESSCNAGDSEILVRSLGWEDLLEEDMATHSNNLPGKIPWTEEHGWLQSMGSQSIRHDLATEQQQLHNTHHCTEFYFNKHFILTKEDNEPEIFFKLLGKHFVGNSWFMAQTM